MDVGFMVVDSHLWLTECEIGLGILGLCRFVPDFLSLQAFSNRLVCTLYEILNNNILSIGNLYFH
jgi:hypothetical protein